MTDLIEPEGANDIALKFDSEKLYIDLHLNEDGSDLLGAFNLENAVIISLFSNQRSDNDDEIPNSQGWPGDSIREEDTPLIGSKLWITQQKGKTVKNRLIEAVDFSESALQWMIEDKIILSATVETSYPPQFKNVMDIGVVLEMPTGENLRFQFSWDQVTNQITQTNA